MSEPKLNDYIVGLIRSRSASVPVVLVNRRTNEKMFYTSTKECSLQMGYGPSWANNIILEHDGYTKGFDISYTTLEEMAKYPDKMSLASLITLIQYWAIDKGIHKSTAKDQMLKLHEETAEISRGLLRNNELEILDGLGDSFVVLVVVAMLKGYHIFDCARVAYNEIKGRTGAMVNNVFVKSDDLK